jgi:hypothetical protein
MAPPTALDWQWHIESGCKFLKTASNGRSRPAVFTPALIHMLTAMAVEQFLVGLWQFYHQMPEDHTLDGLVDGLIRFCPLEKRLAEGIKAMARFDDMCPLVPINQHIPTDGDIQTMLTVAQQTAAFAQQCVKRLY